MEKKKKYGHRSVTENIQANVSSCTSGRVMVAGKRYSFCHQVIIMKACISWRKRVGMGMVLKTWDGYGGIVSIFQANGEKKKINQRKGQQYHGSCAAAASETERVASGPGFLVGA